MEMGVMMVEGGVSVKRGSVRGIMGGMRGMLLLLVAAVAAAVAVAAGVLPLVGAASIVHLAECTDRFSTGVATFALTNRCNSEVCFHMTN